MQSNVDNEFIETLLSFNDKYGENYCNSLVMTDSTDAEFQQFGSMRVAWHPFSVLVVCAQSSVCDCLRASLSHWV
jgi:hypothetical protein